MSIFYEIKIIKKKFVSIWLLLLIASEFDFESDFQ